MVLLFVLPDSSLGQREGRKMQEFRVLVMSLMLKGMCMLLQWSRQCHCLPPRRITGCSYTEHVYIQPLSLLWYKYADRGDWQYALMHIFIIAKTHEDH